MTPIARDELCDKCPFRDKDDVINRVGFSGSTKPVIYIVGIAPGREENLAGEPFIGDSGKYLRQVLHYFHLDDYDIRFGNVCCCYPGENTNFEPPLSDAIRICSQRVRQDILRVKPRIVIVLGEVTARGLLPTPQKFGLAQVIARILPGKIISKTKSVVYPIYYYYHPSYFKRRGAKPHEMDLKPVGFFLKYYDKYYNMLIPMDLMELKPKIDAITIPTKIHDFLEKLRSKPVVAWDYETSGLHPFSRKGKKGKIRTVAFAFLEDNHIKSVALPVDVATIDDHDWNGNTKQVQRQLLEWLSNENTKVAHNLSFELLWSKCVLGLEEFNNSFHDTLALAWMRDERRETHSLDFLAWKYFCVDSWKNQNFSRGVTENITSDLLYYNARDAFETLRLFLLLYESVHWDYSLYQGRIPCYDVYHSILLPMIKKFVHVQVDGVKIDIDFIEEQQKKIEKEIQKVEATINDLPIVKDYKPILLSSSVQVRDFLFKHLKLEPVLVGKTGPSVGERTLQHLLNTKLDKDVKTFIKKLLQYRELTKLNSTYLKGFRKYIDDEQKVHSNFHILGTATGRISSSDPNLQNQPKKKGKFIRNIFIPSKPDHVLVSIDYSQLEAIVLGMYSGDPKFCEAVRTGYDIHRDYAIKVFNDPEKRYLIKNGLIFPAFYGAGVFTIAESLGLTEEKVYDIMNELFEEFSGIKKWQKEIINFYKRFGFVETLTGRRRRIPLSINQILNSPIQGTAGDFALIAVKELPHKYKVKIPVHDELVFELPETSWKEDAEEIATIMVNEPIKYIRRVEEIRRKRYNLGLIKEYLPLTVEVSVGKRWGDMTPYKKVRGNVDG